MRLSAAVILLLACGCAQVREVSGGEKDVDGPRLVQALPAVGAVRFTGDRVLLYFDERVQVKRLREGLLVSPPMDPAPIIRLVGQRAVELRWEAPLLPRTTYSFAIGDAVQDLTEGNAAVSLTYVMSTGDALDSLLLLGEVRDAYTTMPVKDALVVAYAESDSTSFTTGRPAYATRTDAQGRFRLEHLPDARLQVAALKDLNGNYRFDLPNEEVAFARGVLSPSAVGDSASAPVRLHLFQEQSPVQRVMETSVTDDRAWRLVFAKPVEHLSLHDIAREGGRLQWSEEWSSWRDTVLLWPSDTTALAEGRFAIATEAGALDTLRYRSLKPMPFQLEARVVTGSAQPTESAFRIRASRPLRSFDVSAMRLRSDSLDVPFILRLDSSNARAMVLNADLPEGKQGVLLLFPRALRDIYGGSNDTLRLSVGAPDPGSLGKLRVTLSTEARLGEQLILELLDGQGHAVRRTADVALGKPMVWDRLLPGNHTLRLIEDANGNGHWDTGQWRSKRQPERIWLHAAPINVRAGWDLGVEWKLTME